MVLVGMATERFVLRPLVSQSEDTLLMATIGLAFVIEGVAQLAWGVDVRTSISASRTSRSTGSWTRPAC